MDFQGKKVMVVGMARSGIAAGALLLELGATVLLYDQKTKDAFGDSVQTLLKKGAIDAMGADANNVAAAADMLVLSPGVPTKLSFIQNAIKANKTVISEIELGYLTAKAPMVCIGGTNGKTTTTALTGEIFKNSGRKTYVLGNIGVPITEYSLQTTEDDIIVAETAALQLETIDTFRPAAAALLNITEDHLDRFGTMDYYIACKMRMFENMTLQDFAILNYDDEITRAQIINATNARILLFSRKEEVSDGAFVRGGSIVFKLEGVEQAVCPIADVKIPGAHNLENALAATCLAMCMGVEASVVAHTLRAFAGVEHRIEFVREVNGIRFINDSKGTNPDATSKAIEAMSAPTVLLLGGFDKQSDFDSLFAAFTDNIKSVVLLGETKDKLLQAADKAGYTAVQMADSFEQAVHKAYASAEPGDTVLLSPACASWDMFADYEQRGDVFKEIVRNL